MADHSDVEHRTQAMGLIGAAFGFGVIIGATSVFFRQKLASGLPCRFCFHGCRFFFIFGANITPLFYHFRQEKYYELAGFLKTLVDIPDHLFKYRHLWIYAACHFTQA